MIDRSTPVFLLRRKTLLSAAGVSAALFSILPAFWFFCIVAGCVAWCLCWMAVVLMAIIGYGAAIALACGLIVFAGTRGIEDDASTGCLVVLAGVIAVGLMSGLCTGVTEAMQTPKRVLVGTSSGFHPGESTASRSDGWSNQALSSCERAGRYAISDVFVKHRIYIYSWSVLVLAICMAGLTLLSISLLGTETAFKRVFFRIRSRCKQCGLAKPRFRCTGDGCSVWHEDLRPSIFGVFMAKCKRCQKWLPTTDFGGRWKLAQACGNPVCGSDADWQTDNGGKYHLAVIGAQSGARSNSPFAAVWRFHEEFQRSLRGQEGLGLRLAVWAIVIGCYVGWGGVCWCVGGFWLTIVGILAAAAIPLIVLRVSERGLQDVTDAQRSIGQFRNWFRPALVGSRGLHQQRKALFVVFAAIIAIATTILLISSPSKTRRSEAVLVGHDTSS